MNNEYSAVGLYDHNINIYEEVNSSYDEGENVVGIVQATGTGKTYIGQQLCKDNKEKKIIWVVPSKGIIEHIKRTIENNPNLSLERDFPNLQFRTYQSFINMSREELSELDCDMLILDEFHHIGAPVWGDRINTIIETHPNIKVFGMTAYTVRDRGTSYERDMANPDTDELFSNKVVSRYDLCDAMIDGVLPKPIYKSAYVNLIGTERILEEKVKSLNANSKEYHEYMAILTEVKKRIQEAPSIADVVKRNIKPNGKYIYFCPPCSEDGVNDINTIMAEAKSWFLEMDLKEEDIILYSTTSDMGIDGKKNRDAFYNDVDPDGRSADGKLRVMFAINQYNEGIHAPNVDGVIMGRGTTSDIVYFEQLGRALSVRGNTKEIFDEYEKYTIEELLELCKKRDIFIKEDIPKEEIIEKLLAPIIIDLTNNFDFIKELENNLRDRIKEIQAQGLGDKRIIRIRDASFDIEIANKDLFEMLRYVSDRLTMTWEDKYEYAKAYYEHYGNLEVAQSFKTSNGYDYDENGIITLGRWINKQRLNFKLLSEDKKVKLEMIGFILNKHDNYWNKMYEYAKLYYEHHGNLEVSNKFKTSNGYDYDENGKINLGQWVSRQRQFISPESDRGQLLSQIGMRWKNKINNIPWEEMYEYAKAYYEYHDDLEVPGRFKTSNGYDYDENGKINLGSWIAWQRKNTLPESEYGLLLSKIGMRWKNKISHIPWEEMYKYAKAYYEYYGNLEVSNKFKTSNGYDYNENGVTLGSWIHNQRFSCPPESEHGKLLSQIGMRFETNISDIKWYNKYDLAKAYYEYHGNLEVVISFKTINGYDYDENGVALGSWIHNQRSVCPPKSEHGKLLSQIGMRFETRKINNIPWEEMYMYAKAYYEYHGNLEVVSLFKTSNGYDYDENGVVLGQWISRNRTDFQKQKLSSERIEKLKQIGMRFEVNKFDIKWQNNYRLAKLYYEHYSHLEIPGDFITSNGYDYDENGVALGAWIGTNRTAYNSGKLSAERIEKLSQIGMRFETNISDIKWHNKFNLAKAYYEHHGNLEVPKNFKSTNGYERDEKGVALGIWIKRQRNAFECGELLEEYVTKLKSIGMRFDIHRSLGWDEMYEYAKAYYEKHNNLKIPPSFKTSNGYDYDEDGIALGTWITRNRTNFKNGGLVDARKEKLERIGMIFIVKTNSENVEALCIENNIDMKINKKIISNISIQELKSKILFLRDSGITLIDSTGKLHEIFSMSSVNLKIKYGVSLEELIDKYYIDPLKKGVI